MTSHHSTHKNQTKTTPKSSQQPSSGVTNHQTHMELIQRAIEHPTAQTLTPQVVLRLQHLYGNQMVSRMLHTSMESTQSDEPRIHQSTPESMIQRDDNNDAYAEYKRVKARINQLEKTHNEDVGDNEEYQRLVVRLDELDKQVSENAPVTQLQLEKTLLIGEVGRKMNRAYSRYMSACDAKKDELKEAAKQDALFANIVINIFLSLAPSFLSVVGKKITNKLLSKPFTQETMHRIGTFLDKNADGVRTVVESGMGAASEVVWDNMDSNFQHTDSEGFVKALEDAFAVYIEDADKDLRLKTIEELIILNERWALEFTTEGYYKLEIDKKVKKFESEIAPMGRGWAMKERLPEGGSREKSTLLHVYQIQGPNSKRYALVERTTREQALVPLFPEAYEKERLETDDYKFIRWISPEMQEIAIRKAKARNKEEFGRDVVHVLDYKQVDSLPLLYLVTDMMNFAQSAMQAK